jgi:hypothetical protein
MRRAIYHVVPCQNGWGIDHDGEITGPYTTREAALEAAIGPVTNAIKEGVEITLTIPGSSGNESALAA